MQGAERKRFSTQEEEPALPPARRDFIKYWAKAVSEHGPTLEQFARDKNADATEFDFLRPGLGPEIEKELYLQELQSHQEARDSVLDL